MPEGAPDSPSAASLSAVPVNHRLFHLEFFAIDSEETHRTYRDPDDAVAMERLPDGSILLHVAVVDSTVIPVGSLSDKRAARRGESNYMPAYVPMLEKNWYEEIGLWDDARRALVTTVHLSPTGTIEGCWAAREEIRVTSLTHGQAWQHMAESTHPLALMSASVHHLRERREAATRRITSDSQSGLEVGLEGTVSGWTPVRPGQREIHRLIQETMILANAAIAEWALDHQLPFIYRNHGPEVPTFEIGHEDSPQFDVHSLRAEDESERAEAREQIQKFINIRAQYNATCFGHEGVGRRAYAHTTSPLRRYVDIVNQKMMHYAIGLLEPLEALLAETRPAIAARSIAETVWQESGDLIEQAYLYHSAAASEKAKYLQQCVHSITHVLLRCTTELGIAPIAPERVAATAVIMLHSPERALPYRRSDLQQIAEHLNQVLEIPLAQKKRLSSERIDSWLRRVMANPDPSILRISSSEEFTSLIKRAAITGQINYELFDEIRQRMDEHRGIRPVVTYASILAYGPEDGDIVYEERGHTGTGYWQQLKKLVLDEVKFDAGTVDDIIENIEEMYGEKLSVVMENQNLLDLSNHTLHASLCVAKMQDEVLAAPFYVTMPEGHAALARAMARYYFLEHLASKSLVPVEEVILPDTMAASIRRVMYPVDLLVDIAQQHGIHYQITQCEWSNDRRQERRPEDPESEHGYNATIYLSGEKIAELVAANPGRGGKYRARQALWCRKTSSLSMADALARAARNLLGKPEIESLMPSDIIVDYTMPEDPLKILLAAEKEHGIAFQYKSERMGSQTHQRIYEVSLVVEQPLSRETPALAGASVLFSERLVSPDEPHARFELARKAVAHLRKHGFIDNFLQDKKIPEQLPLFTPPAVRDRWGDTISPPPEAKN